MNSHPIPSRPEIFAAALKLGCAPFGEAVARLGYFHDEYVQRRRVPAVGPEPRSAWEPSFCRGTCSC